MQHDNAAPGDRHIKAPSNAFGSFGAQLLQLSVDMLDVWLMHPFQADDLDCLHEAEKASAKRWRQRFYLGIDDRPEGFNCPSHLRYIA